MQGNEHGEKHSFSGGPQGKGKLRGGDSYQRFGKEAGHRFGKEAGDKEASGSASGGASKRIRLPPVPKHGGALGQPPPHSLARKWHAGFNRDDYLKLATELRGDIYAQVRNVVMREVRGQ